MAGHDLDAGGQVAQVRHRVAIVAGWGIAPGSVVLEIGCGQGEGTAALAAVVGPGGRVIAVDPAGPEAGAPVTLGESVDRLLAGPLGSRTEVRFRTDPLSMEPFPGDAFDEAVLIHSAWYFADAETLGATLARLRPWARRLRIAEWDLAATEPGQTPHLLAAVLQGMIEPARAESAANIRTPLSRAVMAGMVERAGWRVTEVRSLDTIGLQDGAWEVDLALWETLPAVRTGAVMLPGHLASLAASVGDALSGLVDMPGRRPLPAYALTAERS
jgi:SAM-dependent methyltransferase